MITAAPIELSPDGQLLFLAVIAGGALLLASTGGILAAAIAGRRWAFAIGLVVFSAVAVVVARNGDGIVAVQLGGAASAVAGLLIRRLAGPPEPKPSTPTDVPYPTPPPGRQW